MADERQPPPIPPADPYAAPATGSDDYWDTAIAPDEEPVVTSTLFFVMAILMIIAALWVTIYLQLLDR